MIEVAFLRSGQYIMNEFTEKNEQVPFDCGGAMSVEPNATVNMQKGRYLVSEFLRNPVSWLETESVYHSLRNADRGLRRVHQWAVASCFLDQSI
jgi:hypothetical protein